VAIALFLGLIGAPGWAAWRWAQRGSLPANLAMTVCVGSVVAFGLLQVVIRALGLGTSLATVVGTAVGFVVLGALAGRKASAASAALPSPWPWAVLASLPALVQIIAMAGAREPGWDFRYIWGLKARVFSLDTGFAPQWLAWPPNGWLHPEYPPLWSSLLAAGSQLGVSPETAALVWQTIIVIGLSAACWEIARPLSPPLRALAAAAGAFAPVITTRPYVGYAELLLAFLLAVAMGALGRLDRARGPDLLARNTLVATCAALALTKNEGMVLAVGVLAALAVLRRWKDLAWTAAFFVLSVAGWQVFLSAHSVGREPRDLSIPHVLGSARILAGWVWGHRFETTGVLVLAWLLVAVSLMGRETRAFAAVLCVWIVGVATAYLSSLQGLEWHLTNSFDRVVAMALGPFVASALLAWRSDGEPSPPDSGDCQMELSRDRDEAGANRPDSL
jgi:hypothetical protein